MRDLTFYLANTPPLPVPRLDVNIAIGTLEAADLPSLLVQKLDGQDRLTEVGHSVDSGVFQAFRGLVTKLTLEDGPGGGANLVGWGWACAHKSFCMLAVV